MGFLLVKRLRRSTSFAMVCPAGIYFVVMALTTPSKNYYYLPAPHGDASPALFGAVLVSYLTAGGLGWPSPA
jgi:hypothetical protein